MATIYVRGVSDDVVSALKMRAATEGASLSTYLAAELSKLAKRPSNFDIVEKLKNRERRSELTAAEVVDIVRESRR